MIHRNQDQLHWSQKSRSLLGAIALGSILLVTSCNTVTEEEEISEGQTNVTTEDVSGDLSTEGTGIEDAESLIGQLVTVRDTVSEMVDDSSFLLNSDSGEPILVINTSGAPFTLPEEDVPIQVTGEVARFVLADVESEYGLDLDEAAYADYEDQPAIIAKSLALAPTTEDLTQNPEAYTDQVIAMEGDVRGIYSPSTFSLFEEGWVDDIGILVVGVDSNLEGTESELQEGETVVVTGRTRPFDATALQQEYDLGLTEDQLNEFTERYNRPVIVAEDIYPSAVDE